MPYGLYLAVLGYQTDSWEVLVNGGDAEKS